MIVDGLMSKEINLFQGSLATHLSYLGPQRLKKLSYNYMKIEYDDQWVINIITKSWFNLYNQLPKYKEKLFYFFRFSFYPSKSKSITYVRTYNNTYNTLPNMRRMQHYVIHDCKVTSYISNSQNYTLFVPTTKRRAITIFLIWCKHIWKSIYGSTKNCTSFRSRLSI